VSSNLLDRWYTKSHDVSVHDVFCADVAIIRHVTDLSTGARSTVCFGFDALQTQTPAAFGHRRKHTLAEMHVPQCYLSFIQSYEVTIDNQKRTWRQSSLRIRMYDPRRNYKLRFGLIFYSERDDVPSHMFRSQDGSLVESPTRRPHPHSCASHPTRVEAVPGGFDGSHVLAALGTEVQDKEFPTSGDPPQQKRLRTDQSAPC
jgi:hypothetical protein